MPAVTYEFGAKNQKLRATLKDSRDQVANYRRQVREQFKSLATDVQGGRGGGAGGGGIFGGMLKANLVIAGVRAVGAAAANTAREIGDLVDVSDQFGVSVDTLDRLTKVMMGAGVTTENLRKAIQGLAQQRQAAIEGDEKAARKFAEVGVAADGLAKMSLEDVFFGVADGLAAIDDDGERATRTMDLLGSRSAKLVAVMKTGGAEIRKEMAKVTGAVGEANARTIDTAGDKLSQMWAETKGWLANQTVEFGKDVKRSAGQIARTFGGAEPAAASPQNFEALDQEKKQQEEQKKKGVEKIAAAKAALELKKEEAGEMERMHLFLDRQAEGEKDRAEILHEQLSTQQKYASAVHDVVKAREDADLADSRGLKGDRERAVLAEKRAAFERQREKQVERFELPQAQRHALERADRAAERSRARGERRFAADQRGRIDRAFRGGRISEPERDRLLDELRVRKGAPAAVKGVGEQTLEEMRNIKTQLEKMGQNLRLL